MIAEAASASVNQVTLAGQIVSTLNTRTAPSGIRISRFTLQHQSVQTEAGHDKKVDCRIIVIAVGEVAEQLPKQDASIVVRGFISYESRDKIETRLVLHAQQIVVLQDPE